MDIAINEKELQNMVREKANYENPLYKKVKGKSGKTWIYGENAHHIFVEPDKKELAPDYKGFKGFGGSTIKFNMVDGTVETLKAPWHTNADALYYDTGIDLRNKHWTICIISKKRERDPFNLGYTAYAKGVIHADTKPILGDFYRPEKLAMKLAKEHNHIVYCFSFTGGGRSSGPVYPDQIDVHGKRRG